MDNKGPPVKRAKEDTKEPEKKKIRKRSVKASAAVKMSHSSGSNYVLVFKLLSVIIHRHCIGRYLYAGPVGYIIKVRIINERMSHAYCYNSPWSDKYENIHQSRYTEQVKAIVALKSQQIKSEAISYSKVIYVHKLLETVHLCCFFIHSCKHY